MFYGPASLFPNDLPGYDTKGPVHYETTKINPYPAIGRRWHHPSSCCSYASIIPFIPSGAIPVLKIVSRTWKKVRRTKRKGNEGEDEREYEREEK